MLARIYCSECVRSVALSLPIAANLSLNLEFSSIKTPRPHAGLARRESICLAAVPRGTQQHGSEQQIGDMAPGRPQAHGVVHQRQVREPVRRRFKRLMIKGRSPLRSSRVPKVREEVLVKVREHAVQIYKYRTEVRPSFVCSLSPALQPAAVPSKSTAATRAAVQVSGAGAASGVDPPGTTSLLFSGVAEGKPQQTICAGPDLSGWSCRGTLQLGRVTPAMFDDDSTVLISGSSVE